MFCSVISPLSLAGHVDCCEKTGDAGGFKIIVGLCTVTVRRHVVARSAVSYGDFARVSLPPLVGPHHPWRTKDPLPPPRPTTKSIWQGPEPAADRHPPHETMNMGRNSTRQSPRDHQSACNLSCLSVCRFPCDLVIAPP